MFLAVFNNFTRCVTKVANQALALTYLPVRIPLLFVSSSDCLLRAAEIAAYQCCSDPVYSHHHRLVLQTLDLA